MSCFSAPTRSRCNFYWAGLLVLSMPLACAVEPAGTLALRCSTNRAGKYQKLEFSLVVPGVYTNPFNPDEIDLKIRCTTPSGKRVEVPAFWYQPFERNRLNGRDWMYPAGLPEWKARFAPVETGEYEAVAILAVPGVTQQSKPTRFECLPSSSKGFIRVSEKDPRFFEFSEGRPFFAIGQNLAFIGSQQYVTLSKAEQILGKLAENGANYLRVWTCCEDWAMAIEARKSAFGRSWDWKPPLAPAPGEESSGRKRLRLSEAKSILRIDPSHPLALRPSTRYLFTGKVRAEPGVALLTEWNGRQYSLPLGEIKEQAWRDFGQEFQTEPGQSWLPPLSLRLTGQGSAWLSGLSLREEAGGPELLWEADVERSIRGFYNPLDCFMLDELLAAAEKHGIVLQLCYLTRDLYMDALKDPSGLEYARAIQDARRALRYAVARWGYSTSVAAWEFWNEMDPGLPTDRFYAELGEYLEATDPYQHLRTTSTWGPSAKDCRHPKLDIADVHFYLRPSDKERLEDEVDAVLERTRWLRQHAPKKPAHLGEFGIANDKWQPTEEMSRRREIVDFHNALWASALSGASGTALFWWWDRLDQRNPYGHYFPLARFIADVPWNGGDLGTTEATCSEPRVRVVGLQARDRAWLWLFNRESAWNKSVVQNRAPGAVHQAKVQIKGLPSGKYDLRWSDTYDGHVIRQHTVVAQGRGFDAEAPDFTSDIACEVRPSK